jgi:hypothetical protein
MGIIQRRSEQNKRSDDVQAPEGGSLRLSRDEQFYQSRDDYDGRKIQRDSAPIDFMIDEHPQHDKLDPDEHGYAKKQAFPQERRSSVAPHIRLLLFSENVHRRILTFQP